MTKSWLKMSKVYKIFAKKEGEYDFSDKAKQEMFDYESLGKGNLKLNIFNSTDNGYFIGKRIMDITLKMWSEDIGEGILTKEELYNDNIFPKWFLDIVLRNVLSGNFIGITLRSRYA